MGHLCNIPDIYWKSLPAAISKPGNSGHFIDVEVLGLPVKNIPAGYAAIQTDFTGKPNKDEPEKTMFSVPDELGSLWWRADQFFRRVVARHEAFAAIVPP